MDRLRGLDRMELATAVAVLVVVTVAGAAAPTHPTVSDIDHLAYLRTIDAVSKGGGFYASYVQAYDQLGIRIGRTRALRQPYLIELLALVPQRARQFTFFAGPVLLSGLLSMRLSRYAPAALVTVAWMLLGGIYTGYDAWLLHELWAVPFVLGACLAWRADRHTTAAVLGGGAILLRETAVLLLLGFTIGALLSAHRRRVLPYLASLAVCAVALVLHWRAAEPHLLTPGTDQDLFVRGGWSAIREMLTFKDLPVELCLPLWIIGLVRLWRSDLRPAVALGLLPLLGIWIDRNYWGLLVMPWVAPLAVGISRRRAAPA